jgi:hypothetical protein
VLGLCSVMVIDTDRLHKCQKGMLMVSWMLQQEVQTSGHSGSFKMTKITYSLPTMR